MPELSLMFSLSLPPPMPAQFLKNDAIVNQIKCTRALVNKLRLLLVIIAAVDAQWMRPSHRGQSMCFNGVPALTSSKRATIKHKNEATPASLAYQCICQWI